MKKKSPRSSWILSESKGQCRPGEASSYLVWDSWAVSSNYHRMGADHSVGGSDDGEMAKFLGNNWTNKNIFNRAWKWRPFWRGIKKYMQMYDSFEGFPVLVVCLGCLVYMRSYIQIKPSMASLVNLHSTNNPPPEIAGPMIRAYKTGYETLIFWWGYVREGRLTSHARPQFESTNCSFPHEECFLMFFLLGFLSVKNALRQVPMGGKGSAWIFLASEKIWEST